MGSDRLQLAWRMHCKTGDRGQCQAGLAVPRHCKAGDRDQCQTGPRAHWQSADMDADRLSAAAARPRLRPTSTAVVTSGWKPP